jgi:Ca-activated chloride channel family protein
MTVSVQPMSPAELGRIRTLPDAGLGALRTDRGNLPLDRLDVRTRITGLISRTVIATEFVNAYDTALEATYVFPLPDRAAVTGMTMTADGRTVEAELQERAAARETYDRAVEAGQRASIAEEERPDVFTMRVGNMMPGERVTVELRLVGPLPYEDGAATFRFPLVVAPRYVPGTPLPGPAVGSGQLPDTDAVPDASRISPPVLLPGFPNPLRLSVDVDIDPAGLELGEVRSSLHTVVTADGHVSIGAGEKADRDFILRLAYADAAEAAVAVPDEDSDEDDREQGTYQLTIMPPAGLEAARPKDVVLLLDRSGSMGGWKMVAARRAAARVVDTLTMSDRFAVLTFDHQIEWPDDLGTGLTDATDRHRFRAVEHLSRADARGGTELLAPLYEGLKLLSGSKDRDRVLVLVTDGQVGNEDQILHDVAPLIGPTRLHTIGIDRAVNAGFLGRLAALGAGRCELVESEDRLDDAMEHIHRRIGSPVVTELAVTAKGFTLLDDTRSPARLPGIYPGVPLVVCGRYGGAGTGTLTVSGRTRDDQAFTATVPVQRREEPAVTAQWARARLRDLEDRYAAGDHDLEQSIVATSLRFGVLCRFTAYVAVDSRVVNEDGETRRVTQPVELPSGWELPAAAAMPMLMSAAPPMPPPAEGATRPQFAPGRATFSRGSSAPPRDGAPMGGVPRSGAPKTFAAIPSSVAASGRSRKAVAPTSSGLSLEDVRQLAALEADRLREASDRAAYDRRDMLADLASRLGVLLDGLTDPVYASLQALVAYLNAGNGDLDTRWAEATSTLEAFGRGHKAPGNDVKPDRERKAFWKR